MTSVCRMCGTRNAPLGSLGARQHYSCRGCGMGWSVATTPVEDLPAAPGYPDSFAGFVLDTVDDDEDEDA